MSTLLLNTVNVALSELAGSLIIGTGVDWAFSKLGGQFDESNIILDGLSVLAQLTTDMMLGRLWFEMAERRGLPQLSGPHGTGLVFVLVLFVAQPMLLHDIEELVAKLQNFVFNPFPELPVVPSKPKDSEKFAEINKKPISAAGGTSLFDQAAAL